MAQQKRRQAEQRPSEDAFSGVPQEPAGRADEAPAPKTDDTATNARPIPRIERIARRAYELFEQRGGDRGRDIEDWLQAEREIDRDE